MRKILTVAISTHKDRIWQIKLPPPVLFVEYLIIHQCQGMYFDYSNHSIFCRDDIRIVASGESGLSNSRNVAIQESRTDFIYIADDDISIILDNLIEAVNFMTRSNIDILTAQFRTESGLYTKKYRDVTFEHNIISAGGVASIEIVLNASSVRFASLRFDERFGLGAKYPSGEEYIFITDAIKAGLRVYYYPEVVAVHPEVTSGDDYFSSYDKIKAKREMLRRVFGRYSLLVAILFWAKKVHKIPKIKHALNFTFLMLSR